MKPILTLAAIAAVSCIMAGGAAQAAPQSIVPAVSANDLLQPVHYPYWRCRAWRRECAVRWGWGGWRYRRCVRLHGC
jgi:hypothetical protein